MPGDARGCPRMPEDAQGTLQNFGELPATFRLALFKNKLEPFKAKPNWEKNTKQYDVHVLS